MLTSASCPQCQHPVRNADHHFCTQCGLALKQPCPQCSSELATPAEAFVSCASCKHDFWSCRSCGRLYHLDRTSCENSYCPEKGKFWTTRFGEDEFLQTPGERCLTRTEPIVDCPRPAWVGGATAGSDTRWPSLHTLGLILSVQDSGVVELWSERGAPHSVEGNAFGETSVCLTRLDLGEESPCAPFYWNGKIFIPGSTSISALDMTSSPSLGQRLALDELGQPRHFCSLGKTLLCWGSQGLGELSGDGSLQKLGSDGPSNSGSFMVSNGRDMALLYAAGSDPVIWSSSEKRFLEIDCEDMPDGVDFVHFADRFLIVAGNKLFYCQDQHFLVRELPASVLAQPLYCASENRLTLLLNDGSARSCSTTGDKFSFVCDLAGTPSTDPIRLGESIFYGTEGRYLCYDEEAIRPRLSAPLRGALSYANGRVFGNLRDGSIFCFEL